MARVLLSGGTGYVGGALAPLLLAGGDQIRSLVRRGSERRLAPGVVPVIADALGADTFRIEAGETLIHLTGVAHPSPAKARQFREIDLVSVQASAEVSQRDGAGHIVYVSVARPAPVMRIYQEVRAECEAIFTATGIPLTILRPWYILGPGHWWPCALKPLYAIAEMLPSTREQAIRLGLVTIGQMVRAIAHAVSDPPSSVRVLGVAEIRQF